MLTQPVDGGPDVAPALYLYAIARARGWRGFRVRPAAGGAPARVRYRDIEALVRATTFELPPAGAEQLQEHHRVVETAMRRGPLLPLPFGVVCRGRRALIRLLHEQYLVIDDALTYLAGAWEMRLHLSPAGGADAELAGELATVCVTELRRHARATAPLPAPGTAGSLLSMAFLVEQAAWIEFVERAEDLGTTHPELSFDVTGPWPPYDFVSFSA